MTSDSGSPTVRSNRWRLQRISGAWPSRRSAWQRRPRTPNPTSPLKKACNAPRATHIRPAVESEPRTATYSHKQNCLPTHRKGDLWNGQLSKWLAVGANLRGRFEVTDTDGQESQNGFDITRGTVYVEANLLDDKLSVYVDQQVAPNSSINREAYVLLKGKKLRFTAGQFYLPFGLRLQDDTAFIRQTTGINFTTPDRGVQLGYESGPWSSAISVTNGSGGGFEIDDGKQVSLMTNYVTGRWRVGASVNHNESEFGDRSMANIFGGIRTGPISWLAEIDTIKDELPGAPDRNALAGLVEGNWRLRRGHNLKVTYEYFDPDDDISENHEARWSALYEFTPFAFLQARFGARANDGPPEVSNANRDILFVELHGFF